MWKELFFGLLVASTAANSTDPINSTNCTLTKLVGPNVNCSECGVPSKECRVWLPRGCHPCPEEPSSPTITPSFNHSGQEFDLQEDSAKNKTVFVVEIVPTEKKTESTLFTPWNIIFIIVGSVLIILSVLGVVKFKAVVSFFAKVTSHPALIAMVELFTKVNFKLDI